MRVLMLSQGGDGLGVAQRLALEGHNVDLWIADDRYARAGRGIVNRVPNWRSALRRADLVVSDCVGFGRWEDVVQASNKPMLGFCAPLDALELDRRKGIELFERAGIQTPESLDFTSTTEARQLINDAGFDDGWVIKPSGNKSADKTMVVKDEALLDHSLR